jgi:hypothetical protein
MFERFTERAQKVMSLANQEAQRLHHEHLGTEHILIGLMAEGTGVGATVLKELGVDLKKTRLAVLGLVEEGQGPVSSEKLPYTPRAGKVMDIAIQEARLLGHNFVGTAHLLLGLLTEREGVGDHALIKLGLDPSQVRMYTLKVLGVTVPQETAVCEPGLALADHLTFWKTLAAGLSRGAPLLNSLKETMGKFKGLPFEVIVDCLIEEVEEGSPLSEAMGVRKSVFSRSVHQMVRAGEAADALDVAAERIVEGLETGSFPFPVNSGIKTPVLARFWRAVGLLVSTGVPLPEVLNVLSAEYAGTFFSKQIQALKQAVLNGQTLADALADFPEAFSPEVCQAVKQAQEQDTLDEAAFKIADNLAAGK